MDIVERLRDVPLFSGVSEFYLSRIAEIAEERPVAPESILSRQAELGATFFIIDSGEAAIYHIDPQGFRRPVGMLRAGNSYGTTSLFVGEPRDATVEAKTAMRVWTIQRPAFQDLLLNYPGLRDELHIPEEILRKLRAPRYPWLQPGEVVVYHTKRHWITFASKMLVATLLALIYSLVIVWLSLAQQVSQPLSGILLLPAVLIYVGYLGWEYVDWQNDYFAVSTQRVTHREQVAFIYESRNEVPLEQVQNTNVITGMIGSLLHFGDLTISSAASMGQMIFTTIPDPRAMQDAINNQIDRVRAIRRAVQRRLIHQDLATHMDLQMPETTPEAPPGMEGPVIYPDAPVVVRQPWLVRAMHWLTVTGLIPRTRFEQGDAVTWRKHWIFLVRRLSLPTTVIAVAGALTALGLAGFPASLVSLVPFYPLLTLASALVGVGWYWWEYTDWSNDLYTVTSDRIIDTEKKPLFFSEQRREGNLGMIQNVTLEIPNVIAGLLNYGDVIVKTAGTGDFTFHNVGNPRDVQSEVFARMSQYKARTQAQEEARRRGEMAEWFSVFDELQRTRGVTRAEPQAGQDAPPDVIAGLPSAQDTDTL
jgi:membrane protein YdbS with pleckstrin-like domain